MQTSFEDYTQKRTNEYSRINSRYRPNTPRVLLNHIIPRDPQSRIIPQVPLSHIILRVLRNHITLQVPHNHITRSNLRKSQRRITTRAHALAAQCGDLYCWEFWCFCSTCVIPSLAKDLITLPCCGGDVVESPHAGGYGRCAGKSL